jgi:hypothetical protein
VMPEINPDPEDVKIRRLRRLHRFRRLGGRKVRQSSALKKLATNCDLILC